MPPFWAMSHFWGAGNYNIAKKNLKKQKNYSYCSKIKVWVPATLTTDHIYRNVPGYSQLYLEGYSWVFMSISFHRAAAGHSQRPASWSVTASSICTCASSDVISATSTSHGQSVWKATSSCTLASDPSTVQLKVSIVWLSAFFCWFLSCVQCWRWEVGRHWLY